MIWQTWYSTHRSGLLDSGTGMLRRELQASDDFANISVLNYLKWRVSSWIGRKVLRLNFPNPSFC